MPARHISPQSFDDILSELGDDPAIADPHGIRKSSSPPSSAPEQQTKLKQGTFSPDGFRPVKYQIPPILILGGAFALLAGALFMAQESYVNISKLEIQEIQSQLLSIRKELTSLQGTWDQDQEDIYAAIDEIEVSIHSINTKPLITSLQNKPEMLPHEAELRHWRYLGLIKMNGHEQAFFHTGKTTKMMAKDDLALGEWRLAQAQKEIATLAHPKGKSIHLKSARSE